MPLRSSLLLSLLFLFACQAPDPTTESPPPGPQLSSQPNILWLVAEDLSPVLPMFGDSTITTPNLSRLAEEGVRYTHVFSPSGVCAPSRAAIATGMYQNHIGAQHMRTGPWFAHTVPDEIVNRMAQYWPPGIPPYEAVPPAEVKMHSQYLREAGYYTTNNAKEDYQFRRPLTAWDESSNTAHWRNRKPGQPFFSIFNFGVTHESQIWARTEDSLWVDADLDVPVPPYLPDNEVGRRDVRRMYSNIKIMDAQVGEILAQLEEDGLMDSTIVFWYTDHGGPLPRQKRLLYDSGMRLPLIIRFPDGHGANTVDDQLVSFIDFKPTIMSLAGLEPPSYVDGRSFLGEYTTSAPRQYVHGAADRFDEAYDMIRAVRDDRFKYLRNFQTEKSYYLPVAYREQMPIMQELLRLRDAGELTPEQAQWFRPQKDEEELFDTQADPYELNNLATDPAYAEKLAELRAECDRWMTAIDDKGLIPEPEFLASLWPNGSKPVTAPPAAETTGSMIALSSATEGANIAYQMVPVGQDTLDTVWQIYSHPLTLPENHKLVTVAHRIGYADSETVTHTP